MPARWYTQPGHMRLQAVRGLVVALLARLQYPPLCGFLSKSLSQLVLLIKRACETTNCNWLSIRTANMPHRFNAIVQLA